MKQGAELISIGLLSVWLLAGCSQHQAPPAHTQQPTNDDAINKCWQQVGARSQLASCLQQALSQAGAKADQAEKAATADSQQLDMMTSANIDAKRNFSAAKRSFHQFRERFCRWQESMSVGGGSGAGDTYRGCYVETTRWWTHLLNRQLDKDQ
ncbi:lysozyme inhibitor LprI family protein [Celerinatantimonas yamalensis]|uniref:Lysozyme inhibitor LprI family protein n=1 Tax=Celerinatantimonas yamalensis TaxID=559956 RepID=A0ABW9G3J5_9GAMM